MANQSRPDWRNVAVLAPLYAAAVLFATRPVVDTFATRIAGSRIDPLQHLWIMRWYKSCLLEGRLPFFCPQAQYPVGAPLGNFSPLGFQALCYIPLSFLVTNDTLCFNLLWLFGLVTTGLATYLLAWTVTRDRIASAMGGLMAMLSAPMMLHSMGHLELIHLGCIPLFLIGWFRFVDRPSRNSLLAAVGLYGLTALCAAYYAVFVTIPAMLYVVWQVAASGRGWFPWIRDRGRWLVAFAILAAASLVPAFSNQVWAKLHGWTMERPYSEFVALKTPVWTYFTPTLFHRMSDAIPANLFEAAGYGVADGERASYLGIIVLLLLNYAAMRRVKFPRAAFWWTLGVTFVVLGCGAWWQVGDYRIPLPGGWLKRNMPGFAMIRVPARFNLFAVIVFAVIASAALKDLLSRLKTNPARIALVAALLTVAMFDLSLKFYPTSIIPPMPPGYAEILRRDPSATFLEVPQFLSGATDLNAVTGYWQSIHRAPTNAGYSGMTNQPLDSRIGFNSPFAAHWLDDPQFPPEEPIPVDILGPVDFHDHAWLFLTANGYRYVVVHKWTDPDPAMPFYRDRLAAALKPAEVYDDAWMTIYARDKMATPRHPVVLSTSGWRFGWQDGPYRAVGREGRLALFVPEGSGPIHLEFGAAAYHKPRALTLSENGINLASWTASPGRKETLRTPEIRLVAGLHELSLTSDGADRPIHHQDAISAHDRGPIGVRVTTIRVGEEAARVAVESPRGKRE